MKFQIRDSDGNDQFVSPSNPMPLATPGDVITFTPVIDVSGGALDAGDVIFDFQAISGFVRAVGQRALIQSLTVIDKDDQKTAMDLFVSTTGGTLGTVDAAPSISDANAVFVKRLAQVQAGDYTDLTGVSIVTLTNIGLMVEAASDSTSIYLGAITRGAPTYTASGLVFVFDLLWF